jgi:hypothetical protein
LKWSDLEFFEALPEKYGKLAGRGAFFPKGLANDKSKSLSLSNTSLRDDHFRAGIIEDLDDPECTFNLLLKFRKMAFLPSWEGHIFVRRCPEKYLQKRQATVTFECIRTGLKPYDCHQGDNTPRKIGSDIPRGKIGHSYPGQRFKAMAKRCDFVNFERFTGRSARRSGISKMVNAGVAGVFLNQAARHTVDSTNQLYQEFTDATYLDSLVSTHYSTQQSEYCFVCCCFHSMCF